MKKVLLFLFLGMSISSVCQITTYDWYNWQRTWTLISGDLQVKDRSVYYDGSYISISNIGQVAIMSCPQEGDRYMLHTLSVKYLSNNYINVNARLTPQCGRVVAVLQPVTKPTRVLIKFYAGKIYSIMFYNIMGKISPYLELDDVELDVNSLTRPLFSEDFIEIEPIEQPEPEYFDMLGRKISNIEEYSGFYILKEGDVFSKFYKTK